MVPIKGKACDKAELYTTVCLSKEVGVYFCNFCPTYSLSSCCQIPVGLSPGGIHTYVRNLLAAHDGHLIKQWLAIDLKHGVAHRV